jgi:hypothetical protein
LDRIKAARTLVVLGSIVLIASAALHCFAGYPGFSQAIGAANVNASLIAVSRTVFLLVGWDWFVIAAIVLIAALTKTRIGKPVVVLCGIALLVSTAICLRFIGPFIGDEMLGGAAVFILLGGSLFDRLGPPGGA